MVLWFCNIWIWLLPLGTTCPQTLHNVSTLDFTLSVGAFTAFFAGIFFAVFSNDFVVFRWSFYRQGLMENSVRYATGSQKEAEMIRRQGGGGGYSSELLLVFETSRIATNITGVYTTEFCQGLRGNSVICETCYLKEAVIFTISQSRGVVKLALYVFSLLFFLLLSLLSCFCIEWFHNNLQKLISTGIRVRYL